MYVAVAEDPRDPMEQIRSLPEERQNSYVTEYDFQLDVYRIVSAAYDDHLFYVPDIVGLFQFNREVHGNLFEIVSISRDGVNLPDIFANLDLPALASNTSRPYEASPIVAVNGIEVQTYLNTLATVSGRNQTFQDPDANYNALFPNLPNQIGTRSFGNTFAFSYFFQGDVTAIKFANGTTAHVSNVARTQQNLTGVTDGAELFERCCSNTTSLQQLIELKESSTTLPTPGPTTLIPFSPLKTSVLAGSQPTTYPQALTIAFDNSIAGYLPDSAHDDLAVLAIPNFAPINDYEFVNVARGLLATAKAHSKTKLIIDVRGNDGGTISQPYAIFRQM